MTNETTAITNQEVLADHSDERAEATARAGEDAGPAVHPRPARGRSSPRLARASSPTSSGTAGSFLGTRTPSPSGSNVAEREQRRWIVALLAPFVAASAFLCATFATAGGAAWTNWFFAPALLLVPAWIGTLVYLALTSDTNEAGERLGALPAPSAERSPERKAA